MLLYPSKDKLMAMNIDWNRLLFFLFLWTIKELILSSCNLTRFRWLLFFILFIFQLSPLPFSLSPFFLFLPFFSLIPNIFNYLIHFYQHIEYQQDTKQYFAYQSEVSSSSLIIFPLDIEQFYLRCDQSICLEGSDQVQNGEEASVGVVDNSVNNDESSLIIYEALLL